MDNVALNEMTLYRFGAIETEVKQLIEANHEMAKSIASLVTELSIINSNISRLVDLSNKVTERISILEDDLQERTIRKKVYKSLIAFYPLVIVSLLIIMNIDHQKIRDVLTEIKLIMPIKT